MNDIIKDKITQAITAIRNGKMVIVIDDIHRENEGDLIGSAQTMTNQAMATMIRHSSGIICAPITAKKAQECGLSLMVDANNAPFQTNFTISIDAKGTSTGISATDRLLTVHQLAKPTIQSQDFVKPGHIFPLIAREGGVLVRPGHTEAAVDLCYLANLPPVAVIGELMNDDGTVQKGDQITKFAQERDLITLTIAELSQYLRENPIQYHTDKPTQSVQIFGKSPRESVYLVPVKGKNESENSQFAVNRIFCVGRNYEAHALEMGSKIDRESPFYFTKSPQALILSGTNIPFALGTQNFHYEMEFVVAIGLDGQNIAQEHAMHHVFGYGCGLDLTRRDLQTIAKDAGKPWDLSKDFADSAVIAPLTTRANFGDIKAQKIQLWQNDQLKQDADISTMVWSVPEIISHLSQFYHLKSGDLIYTGTPAGVGAMRIGDKIRGAISGLCPIECTIIKP